jgi:hypothetical protein
VLQSIPRSLSVIDFKSLESMICKIYHFWYVIDSMWIIKSQTLMTYILLGLCVCISRIGECWSCQVGGMQAIM